MEIPISYHRGEEPTAPIDHPIAAPLERIGDGYARLKELARKTARQVSALVSREDLKTVLTLQDQDQETPADSNYAAGDVIHTLLGGCVPAQFKIYGVKIGGYGIVYTVLDQNTLTPYCLKTPRYRSPDDLTPRDTLEAEARVWLLLGKHPNIVYAHSLLDINGSRSILLEYVPGGDLTGKIRKGALPLDEALDYGIQFCRGMRHAQTVIPGFVHGDIKPSNCLLTQTGTLKIADFGHVGLSKKNTAQTNPLLLNSLYAAGGGTPAYMAPELLHGSSPPDPRSDIYAYGIMLYEMLAGHRPHEGRTHEQCIEEQRKQTAYAAVVGLVGAPQELRDLIINCIAHSPEQRPQSFEVIEQTLSSILRNISNKEIPIPPPTHLADTELISRGASLAVLGEYDQALACFESLLTAGVESALILNYKAQALLGCNRDFEAAKCMDQALKLNPRQALTWNNKGRLLHRLGKESEALACFDRALALDPRMAFAWNDQGFIFSDLERLESSGKCLKRALAIDPHHAGAYNNQGILYYKRGLLAEAKQSFSIALHLNPSLADAYVNLGDTNVRLGLVDDALEVYRQALALVPDRETVKQKLGFVYREIYSASPGFIGDHFAQRLVSFLLDRATDSQLVIDRSLELLTECGFDPVVLYLCGDRIYQAIEKTEDQREDLAHALAQVRASLRSGAGNRTTSYWLGKLFYGLDLYPECIKVFEDSIQSYGPDARSFYYLAACDEVNLRYAAALDHYRHALALDSQCPLTRAAIERVESRLEFDGQY